MSDLAPIWKTPTRDQAVETLRACRTWTDGTIAALTPEQMEVPTPLGDGTWSIKDLLGHLTAWEKRALDVVEATDTPPDAQFASTEEFNAHQLEVTRAKTLEDVQRAYDEVRSRLVASIEAMSDERWNEKILLSSGRRSSRALVVAKVLSGGKHGYLAHDFDHRRDLEKAIRLLTAPER